MRATKCPQEKTRILKLEQLISNLGPHPLFFRAQLMFRKVRDLNALTLVFCMNWRSIKTQLNNEVPKLIEFQCRGRTALVKVAGVPAPQRGGVSSWL